MAFLDFIADWAEEHIPLVGDWIAELVRKLQSAIEGAWGWIKDEVSYLKNTWVPWAENQLSALSDSLSAVWDEISDYLEPAVSALSDALNEVKDTVESTAQELRQLLDSFAEMVWNAIPDWLKEGAEKAIDEIPRLWDHLNNLSADFEAWMDNKEAWFLEQLNRAKSIVEGWINDAVSSAEEWLSEKISAVKSELHRAVTELRNDLETAKKELSDKLSGFREWVEEKVHNTENAIMHIDDYILNALVEFIVKMMMWFIASFIDDLAHLQYDPVEKKVYGTPKNPITHILIWFFEVEKPENPYRSVKPELGVKEARRVGYVRP